MNSPYLKEQFLNEADCAALILLVRRYAKKNALPRPAISTEKRTEVAAISVYAHGRTHDAELLSLIRGRCQGEIENHFELRKPIYPELMVIHGNYPGDGYDCHADNCCQNTSGEWIPNETAHRAISCVICLNGPGVDFEGGELVFSAAGKVISPRPGLFIAFPSNERFEHEVRTIQSGARYSILLWFTENPAHAAGPLMPKIQPGKVKSSLPRKLILRNQQSPGDLLMLTAAVRDLQLSHPGKFLIDVDTPFPQIWEFNPYLTRFGPEEGAEVMQMHYPLIHESNDSPLHFIHGFRLYLETQLNIRIKPTKFRGDIHFSSEEISQPSMVHTHFTGRDTPFWLICTGGKKDYTAKWWIPEFAQEVVDHFKNRIQFVQFGGEGPNHEHPPLRGVINLVGKTDIRELMRLVYHSSGVVCPVTFAMHLAAAVPAKPGLPSCKACVVTAGGREPSHFTAYTHHVYLHTNGQMTCTDNGGCWKCRTIPLNDGDEKDLSLCIDTVPLAGRQVQRCMHDLVTAHDVIRGIERYHEGGALRYLSSGCETIAATWDERKTR